MDEMLMCDVCSLEFNSTCVIPKVLPYGHSFCSPCIIEVIATNAVCPKCRQAINGSEDSLPINYAILGIIDAVKATENESGLLLRSIEVLKKKYMLRKDILLKKKSEVGSYLVEIESSLEIIESGLTKLQELINTENNEIDTRRAKTVISKLENDFKKTENFSHFMLPQISFSTTISLTSFENPKAFLTEVYNALKNSEKVFALKSIDNKLKFGEMMVRDNKILIYSLTLDTIPDGGAKTVLFQDLKDCMSDYLMHPFLEITGRNGTSHLIIIKLEVLRSCPHFIKLCTGEIGPSYHGKSYTKYDVRLCSDCGISCSQNRRSKCGIPHNIPTLLRVEMLKSLPTDYCKNSSTSVACMINEIILMDRSNDDGFELRRVTYESSYYIMGKVIYPSDICEYILPIDDNSQTPKILGCGIILEL